MSEDIESWVWSHYTLDPTEQDLQCPTRLTCLECMERVTHVKGESLLAQHLRSKHVIDGRANIGLGELLKKNTKRPGILSRSKSEEEVRAFFDRLGKEQIEACKVCGERIHESIGKSELLKHLRSRHPHLQLNGINRLSGEVSAEKGPSDDGDLDSMLMASFEAEMKRQMAAATTTARADVEIKLEPICLSSNTSVKTPLAFSTAALIANKSTGKRKRATSPSEIAGGFLDDAKRIRGASTPDNLDDDDSLGVKVEQGEGSKSDFKSRLAGTSCSSLTSSERSMRSSKSQSSFVDGKRRRSDVSVTGKSISQNSNTQKSNSQQSNDHFDPGNSNSQQSFDHLETFSRGSTPIASQRRGDRSSSRASSVSSNSSSLAFACLAESVKKRRGGSANSSTNISTRSRNSSTDKSSSSSSSSYPSGSVKYQRGVVRRTLHKLTRRCGTLWTASRWTDFDMELVFCRPVDRERPVKTEEAEETVAQHSSSFARKYSSFEIKKSKLKSKVFKSRSSNASIKHTIVGSYSILSRNRFSCLHCDKVYRRVALLGKHLRKRHFGRYFTCEFCRRKFLTNRYRLNHIETKHRPGLARCFSFSAASSSSAAARGSHGHKCNKCRLVFRRVYSLKLHRCLVHKKRFRLKTKLISLDDLLEIADPQSQSQSQKEEAEEEEEKPKEKRREEEVPIMCSNCNGIYVTKIAFKNHREKCHQESKRKRKTQYVADDVSSRSEINDVEDAEEVGSSDGTVPDVPERPASMDENKIFELASSPKIELSQPVSASSSCDSLISVTNSLSSKVTASPLSSSSKVTACLPSSSSKVTASLPSSSSKVTDPLPSSSTPPKADESHSFPSSSTSQPSSSTTHSPPKTDESSIVTSSSPSSHLCPHCIKTFPSYPLLKRHVDVCHNAKAILAARKIEADQRIAQTCTACDDVFLSTQALVKHLSKRHEEAEIVSCDWWTWSRDDDEWVQHTKPLVYHV